MTKRFACVLILLLAAFATVTSAQETTRITIGLPGFQADQLPDDAFDAFEATNPGVEVVVVELGDEQAFFPPAYINIDEHLNGVESLVSAADVLPATEINVSPESIAAEYWLNLQPLLEQNPDIANDFYPAALDAFAWDGGVYALPGRLELTFLGYNQARFDELGLEYPAPDWTLDDFTNAARQLTTYNEEGAVSIPGLMRHSEVRLLFALLGQRPYDATTSPPTPQINLPAMAALYAQWQSLLDEGIIGYPAQGDSGMSGAMPQPNMEVGGEYLLYGGDENTTQPALLPGGVTYSSAQGYGISSGTAYPELAFALVDYLTGDPELASRFYGPATARRSISGQSEFGPPVSPEKQAFLDDARANALPVSALFFADYITEANRAIDQDGLDPAAALEVAQSTAEENMALAAERAGTPITVAAPPAPPELAPGEIGLNFGIIPVGGPPPDETRLQEAADAFAASQPEIGFIEVDTSFSFGLELLSNEYDCFIAPAGLADQQAVTPQINALLSLDPFLDTDPNFDPTTLTPGTLAQMQFNGRTLGLPVSLQPYALFYNAELFASAGIPEPVDGWTPEQFVDALNALDSLGTPQAPYAPSSTTGTHILLLIGGFGGVPLDYNTDPVTLNFTDPVTVDAIRRVLDLAKADLINYTQLARRGGGGGGGGEVATITPASLGLYALSAQQGENNNRIVTFPAGPGAPNVLHYTMNAAFISANSPAPEACYEWISSLSRDPLLVQDMPADLTLLDAPGFRDTQSDLALAFYDQYAARLQTGNAIVLPEQFSADIISSTVQFELYRAFDAYVLEDADLEAALGEAEVIAGAFVECMAGVDPALSQEESIQAMSACMENTSMNETQQIGP